MGGSGEINSQSVGGRFSLWLLAARMSFIALGGAVFWHASRHARAAHDWSRTTELLALSAGAGGYLVAICFGFSEAMTSWSFWLLLGAVVGLQTERALPLAEGFRTL